MSVIDELKAKTTEVEDLIKVRRKSRMEFSFSMSKNLLKTISNLSLEVMNLNQTTFKGLLLMATKPKLCRGDLPTREDHRNAPGYQYIDQQQTQR